MVGPRTRRRARYTLRGTAVVFIFAELLRGATRHGVRASTTVVRFGKDGSTADYSATERQATSSTEADTSALPKFYIYDDPKIRMPWYDIESPACTEYQEAYWRSDEGENHTARWLLGGKQTTDSRYELGGADRSLLKFLEEHPNRVRDLAESRLSKGTDGQTAEKLLYIIPTPLAAAVLCGCHDDDLCSDVDTAFETLIATESFKRNHGKDHFLPAFHYMLFQDFSGRYLPGISKWYPVLRNITIGTFEYHGFGRFVSKHDSAIGHNFGAVFDLVDDPPQLGASIIGNAGDHDDLVSEVEEPFAAGKDLAKVPYLNEETGKIESYYARFVDGAAKVRPKSVDEYAKTMGVLGSHKWPSTSRLLAGAREPPHVLKGMSVLVSTALLPPRLFFSANPYIQRTLSPAPNSGLLLATKDDQADGTHIAVRTRFRGRATRDWRAFWARDEYNDENRLRFWWEVTKRALVLPRPGRKIVRPVVLVGSKSSGRGTSSIMGTSGTISTKFLISDFYHTNWRRRKTFFFYRIRERTIAGRGTQWFRHVLIVAKRRILDAFIKDMGIGPRVTIQHVQGVADPRPSFGTTETPPISSAPSSSASRGSSSASGSAFGGSAVRSARAASWDKSPPIPPWWRSHFFNAGYSLSNDRKWARTWSDSKFCLMMRGDTFSMKTFVYAIRTFCIPVIVSDLFGATSLPFPSTLRTRAFAAPTFDEGKNRTKIEQRGVPSSSGIFLSRDHDDQRKDYVQMKLVVRKQRGDRKQGKRISRAKRRSFRPRLGIDVKHVLGTSGGVQAQETESSNTRHEDTRLQERQREGFESKGDSLDATSQVPHPRQGLRLSDFAIQIAEADFRHHYYFLLHYLYSLRDTEIMRLLKGIHRVQPLLDYEHPDASRTITDALLVELRHLLKL
ncbi:unnamed protein product [Amoebophrya sp. A25]|nr:unnamed protein product [Amoebophrya sp. A25]|eukprot:GSA25T00021198001.1